jgi:hypothetical protein
MDRCPGMDGDDAVTLIELKDAGLMPSPTQILFLEIDAVKKCRSFNYPHRYHCLQLSTSVQRTVCWELLALWRNLEEWFPGIEINKS